jgi:hypothetical protein
LCYKDVSFLPNAQAHAQIQTCNPQAEAAFSARISFCSSRSFSFEA